MRFFSEIASNLIEIKVSSDRAALDLTFGSVQRSLLNSVVPNLTFAHCHTALWVFLDVACMHRPTVCVSIRIRIPWCSTTVIKKCLRTMYVVTVDYKTHDTTRLMYRDTCSGLGIQISR